MKLFACEGLERVLVSCKDAGKGIIAVAIGVVGWEQAHLQCALVQLMSSYMSVHCAFPPFI